MEIKWRELSLEEGMAGRAKDNLSIKMYLTLTLIVPAVSSADYRLQCGRGRLCRIRWLQSHLWHSGPIKPGRDVRTRRSQHYMMIIWWSPAARIFGRPGQRDKQRGEGIFTQITHNLDVANQILNEYLVTLGKYLNLIFVKRRWS